VKMGATDRNVAGTLAFNVTLRTSADGFASDLDVALTVADQNDKDPLYVLSYLDLSSLGIVTDALEFRLYFDDNSGSGSKHPLLDTVSLLDLYRAGHYYLPVNEKLEIPSKSEWDEAFFRSVTSDELKLDQSLKAMYSSAKL